MKLVGTSSLFSFFVLLLLVVVNTTDATKSKAEERRARRHRRVCTYKLDLGDEETGQGTAIASIAPIGIRIAIRGAKPNTLYTVWTDFRNRATGNVTADYPIPENTNVDISRTGPGVARGVAPTMATQIPVYEGTRWDRNAVMTDAQGNAKFTRKLRYNLLLKGKSPVVAESLTMQGENRVGGSWLRMYEKPLAKGPSRQVLNKFNRPVIARATAQGLTIVGHFIPLTHGHTPGVGGVDHFPGFKGDFPASCKP